ncbi:MAG: hypothetical protein Q9208_002174 [Pyrenodesmia sp. 3 TL-2023]
MASVNEEEERIAKARGFLVAVNQVQSFFKTITQQMSVLSEARVFEKVDNVHLIRAFEGGTTDCGLFLHDEIPSGTLADQLFELARSRRGEFVVVPIELKLAFPATDSKGNVTWRFSFSSQGQLDACQAVVVSSILAPDLVAFIPMHYIRQRGTLKPKSLFMETARYEWALHAVPPFPPEWAPFIEPLAHLGKALECMRQYTLGVAPEWVNERTGARYSVPRPTHFSTKLLQPDFVPWRKALKVIARVHRAFRKSPGDFEPELLDIFPLYGDFKFVQRSTGTEIIVEIKGAQCEWELDRRDPFMEHCQYAIGFKGRKIFSWKTQWDFLLTKHKSVRTLALFLPRDLIPFSWWNQDPPNPSGKLSWPSHEAAILKDYVVDLSSDSQLVADITRIFDLTKRHRSSLKALNCLPPAPYELTAEPETPTPDGYPDAFEEITALKSNYGIPKKRSPAPLQRGFGSSLHKDCRGTTCEVWAREALTELFRARGKGLIVDTGRRNLLGRFFFANYTWSPLDYRRYDRYGRAPDGLGADGDTPVIPLAFVTLAWPEMLYPTGTTSGAFTGRALEHRLPSLLICDAYPIECNRQPHARFIVPSAELRSPILYRKTVRFDSGIMDQHHASDDEVVDILIGALEGNLRTSLGTTTQTRQYSCFLKTAMEGAVEGFAKAKPTKETPATPEA